MMIKSDLNSLEAYDYELPENLIATKPANPKESANLLIYNRKSCEISHLKFGDLPEILPPCDIIFNDTKVIKARIYGVKESGGKVEILLNRPLIEPNFSVYIKGSVKVGTRLKFDANLEAIVTKLNKDGSREVEFLRNNKTLGALELFEILNHIGHTPLPPYIKRDDTKDDESWYQTIFAKKEGAVAAPTASLHFSPQMINLLKKSHSVHYLTLHVGAGTFKSVEVDDIREHKMHSEWFDIPTITAEILKSDKKILGVGTTVTRVVENFARTGALQGECELFLNHLNRPIRQNFLLTNFHLPKSTLIMLVTSFIGYEATMEIYRKAIEKKYKFYSYGDAMLIV